MVPARARLAMIRSGSVQKKQPTIAYNISGWTLAASTSQAAPSSKRLSIPCTAGTKKPEYASHTLMTCHPTTIYMHQSLAFLRAGGLLGAGLFRSLSRHQTSFSLPGTGQESVPRMNYHSSYPESRAYL